MKRSSFALVGALLAAAAGAGAVAAGSVVSSSSPAADPPVQAQATAAAASTQVVPASGVPLGLAQGPDSRFAHRKAVTLVLLGERERIFQQERACIEAAASSHALHDCEAQAQRSRTSMAERVRSSVHAAQGHHD